jgi:cold shock CspA family protein
MKGIVRRLVTDRYYGFIRGTDHKDYFFHKDDFLGHWDDLVTDFNPNNEIEVEFLIVGDSTRGPRARNVSRLDFPNQTGG